MIDAFAHLAATSIAFIMRLDLALQFYFKLDYSWRLAWVKAAR